MNEENNTTKEVIDAEVKETTTKNSTNETVEPQTNTTSGYNPTFQPKNDNTGNVPPQNNGPQVIYVERPRKPFPWKSVLKYICVFLVAGLCGFGGGLLANNFDNNANKQDFEFDDDGPSMKDFFDNDDNSFGGFGYSDDNSNGNGSSSSKTNTNSAGIGIQITEEDDGVYIKGFSNGSKAEEAGLKIGDKIVALDGKQYDTYDDIVEYLSDKEVGDTVKVTVERDDEEQTFTVELSAMSSSNSSLPSSNSSDIQ